MDANIRNTVGLNSAPSSKAEGPSQIPRFGSTLHSSLHGQPVYGALGKEEIATGIDSIQSLVDKACSGINLGNKSPQSQMTDGTVNSKWTCQPPLQLQDRWSDKIRSRGYIGRNGMLLRLIRVLHPISHKPARAIPFSPCCR